MISEIRSALAQTINC
ncbi:hypothetical protein ACVXHA_20310 [Escherichia coli]